MYDLQFINNYKSVLFSTIIFLCAEYVRLSIKNLSISCLIFIPLIIFVCWVLGITVPILPGDSFIYHIISCFLIIIFSSVPIAFILGSKTLRDDDNNGVVIEKIRKKGRKMEFILITLLIPLVEELMYRVLLSYIVGEVGQSFIFAVMHYYDYGYSWMKFCNTLVIALILTFYLPTIGFIGCFLLHGIINCMWFFSVRRNLKKKQTTDV